MARIRVVTDSACDLSADLAAERGVTVVPLSIRFGSEEFVDESTLSTDEFWARCEASPVLPETSAPSPGAFQQAFGRGRRRLRRGPLHQPVGRGVRHLPGRRRGGQGGGRPHPGPGHRLPLDDHGPRA